jgi:hypothetical protein
MEFKVVDYRLNVLVFDHVGDENALVFQILVIFLQLIVE